MHKLKCTLWACLLSVSVSFAQQSYTVRKGDTPERIAKVVGISLKSLRTANTGRNIDRIKPGEKLRLPSSSKSAKTASVKPAKVAASTKGKAKAGTVSYKIQEGDNDWIIARRNNIRVAELKAVNPGVDFNSIRPGHTIRIPKVGGSAPVVASRSKSIQTSHAQVNGANVIIRRGPSQTESRITLVQEGTVARIVDRDGDWVKLKFPYGTVGWVRQDLLNPVSSVKARQIARKMGAPLDRATPQAKSRTRVAYHKSDDNDRPTTSRDRKPSRARRSDGGGWVASASGDVLGTAQTYLGVRYRYGGTSRSGIDCSGFTSSVYRANGVRLPRTAAEQSNVGQSVSKGDLKKGDLVFFKTRGSRVGHVGMYVGDGKFIHASSGRGQVTVSSLGDRYYANRYAGAKRVSKSVGNGEVTSSSRSGSRSSRSSGNSPEPKPKHEDPEPAPDASKDVAPVKPGTDEITK